MSRQADRDTRTKRKSGRPIVEWISLGINAAIILLLIGLVLYAHVSRTDRPAAISVEPQVNAVRYEGGQYYLPVAVTNTGGRTAEDVWVKVTLAPPQGREEASEFTIRFLAGGEWARAEAIFRQDPSQGHLSVTMSHLVP